MSTTWIQSVHKEGQMRIHWIDPHPGTDKWVGPSTALYFVSPQDVARTLYQHDQWVISAAKGQASKTTWQRLQGNPSQRSRRALSQMRGPSLPAFVRESRAQDVSSSQRPRCSISADAAFVGWESRWPGEDIRVDVVPEWKFVWTSGYFIFLDKSQFQGTEKVDILALLKLNLGVESPLT